MQISKTSADFSQAFATSSEAIATFFAQPGVGYYIPLYQREYSWDLQNINQLMEDLFQGVDLLLERDDAILFMGTVILLAEANRQNINPRDHRALPTRIDNVIDGQQRISTFALLATMIYMRLHQAGEALESASTAGGVDQNIAPGVQDVLSKIRTQCATLLKLFSVDLDHGNPTVKPVIIRGSIDGWTFDGADDDNYKSDVSNYLALFIRSVHEQSPFPLLKGASGVKKNLRRINEYLDAAVNAHKRDSSDYPTASSILTHLPQEAIWSYDRPDLAALVTNQSTPLTDLEDKLSSVVQLLALVNFLFKRCCFTVIRPTAQNWAFDMFQSLNATGTPLTAIETFKPMVSNYMQMHGGYRGSRSEQYFADVDGFLNQVTTANAKNRLTNEYLTTFALVQDGTKLPSQFSAQRRYLEERYDQDSAMAAREEFMRRMSDLASYRRASEVTDAQTPINLIESASAKDRELAALSIAYLKKANHRMADTILSRFYSVLRRADASTQAAQCGAFISVCKAVAAFYTLWRAASPNSGLDDFYRKLLRGTTAATPQQPTDGFSWAGDPQLLTVNALKQRLQQALVDRNIGDKAAWINRAQTELRYGNGVDQVCRFASLVAADDTVLDPNQPGLMVQGQPGVQPYLSLDNWFSADLSTIEHIAPQNSDARAPWDSTLYSDECYQRIGNLTLLPLEINISASNRGWKEKCLYYEYLVVQNPTVDRPRIQQDAQANNVTLNVTTTDKLLQSTHKAHIRPVAAVSLNGQWNRALVEARSERICDILWDRIYAWLQ